MVSMKSRRLSSFLTLAWPLFTIRKAYCSRLIPHYLSMSSISSLSVNLGGISYISSSQAKQIDEILMSKAEDGGHFALEQLMELAGLSVACAAYDYLHNILTIEDRAKIIVLCGPGNNGGDGLVCARHLIHFGYEVSVVIPSYINDDKGKQTPFLHLVKQCTDLDISVQTSLPVDHGDFLSSFHLIIDSLFGFSFHGVPRDPYANMIAAMASSSTPCLAVDIPSG